VEFSAGAVWSFLSRIQGLKCDGRGVWVWLFRELECLLVYRLKGLGEKRSLGLSRAVE
jgi:hypothetical protein